MSITVMVDCTGDNLSAVLGHLQSGAQLAGYTTGSDGIAWTSAQFDRSPAPVRICQDSGATDTTADVLDIESGAATPADAPGWYKSALANFNSAKRPGQRKPCVYVNESNLTSVANALLDAGLTDVPVWLADYSVSQSGAEALVDAASGDYPLIGVQFDPNVDNLYDVSVVSSAWLAEVSKKPDPKPPANQTGTVTSKTTHAVADVVTEDGGLTWFYAPLKHYAGNVLDQTGMVLSETTKGIATVTTIDGGLVWHYVGKYPGPVKDQSGFVSSKTTKAVADVVSNDGGLTWFYAPLSTYMNDILNQTGTVHSDTTGGTASVTTTDGGLTWQYA